MSSKISWKVSFKSSKREYFRYLENLKVHDDLMERDYVLINRVFNILAELLKTKTKKEYENFLRKLKRNVSLYYDRAEAKRFRKVIGELIDKKVSKIST